MAKFFLDIRGKSLDGRELGGKYNQDHLPIVDQNEAVGHAVRASNSTVSVSYGKNPQALNDQLEPKNSIDHSVPYYHWWPHKGTTEWVEYEFPRKAEVSTIEVYWFDDTGIGECRLPKSWKILYRDSKDENKWRPVYTTDLYGTDKDKFNVITFETVRTGALRLEIISQPEFAGGIHELRVK